MIATVILYDDAAVQTGYSFCHPSLDDENGYTGPHQPETLPAYVNIPFRAVGAPAPFAYAGLTVTGTYMLSDTEDGYSLPAFQTWLHNQPTATDFDTDLAWPS